MLSPVRADSSASSRTASSSRASAGTRSPAFRITTSPGTSSSASTVDSKPLRRTRVSVRDWRRSASRARPACHSVAKPTAALSTRTIRIANASALSPVAQEITAAIARRPITYACELIDEDTPCGTRLNPLKGVAPALKLSFAYLRGRESSAWIDVEYERDIIRFQRVPICLVQNR